MYKISYALVALKNEMIMLLSWRSKYTCSYYIVIINCAYTVPLIRVITAATEENCRQWVLKRNHHTKSLVVWGRISLSISRLDPDIASINNIISIVINLGKLHVSNNLPSLPDQNIVKRLKIKENLRRIKSSHFAYYTYNIRAHYCRQKYNTTII